MIQFFKNIWYAQRNARDVGFWKAISDGWNGLARHTIEENFDYRSALAEIASSNPKNANGTVRKHVRIARDALGWRNRC